MTRTRIGGRSYRTIPAEVIEGAARERQILFSAPMVRAILDGRKTKTRRVVTPQPARNHGLQPMWGTSPAPNPTPFGTPYLWREVGPDYPDDESDNRRCPFGQPGDQLWVRETAWYDREELPIVGAPRCFFPGGDVVTRNRGLSRSPLGQAQTPEYMNLSAHLVRRPSIHMPRWASRITLEVTDVRVERLQEVTDTEAIAEGIDGDESELTPRNAFSVLWQELNGERGFGWDVNPWVWVIGFKRIQQAATA